MLILYNLEVLHRYRESLFYPLLNADDQSLYEILIQNQYHRHRHLLNCEIYFAGLMALSVLLLFLCFTFAPFSFFTGADTEAAGA